MAYIYKLREEDFAGNKAKRAKNVLMYEKLELGRLYCIHKGNGHGLKEGYYRVESEKIYEEDWD